MTLTARLGPEAAHQLYLNMIVFTHGLAVLLAAGIDIPEDELADRVFIAFSLQLISAMFLRRACCDTCRKGALKLVFEPMRETRTGESGASQPVSV